MSKPEIKLHSVERVFTLGLSNEVRVTFEIVDVYNSMERRRGLDGSWGSLDRQAFIPIYVEARHDEAAYVSIARSRLHSLLAGLAEQSSSWAMTEPDLPPDPAEQARREVMGG